jgi:protein gp37
LAPNGKGTQIQKRKLQILNAKGRRIMAENSKIEWTHHTANLWWGCTEVHEGCDNCYAKAFSHRYDGGNPLWGKDAPRRMIKSVWKDLAKYQRKAEQAGEIHRVFVGSMMDIFEKPMPLLNPFDRFENTGDLRQELFTKIGMGHYPNLLFLLLTKRPSNIYKYVPAGWLDDPEQNVMYGTSVVNQQTFEMLVPQLTKVKGKRFLSMEPQLDRVLVSSVYKNEIDWIIQGGESGHGKRPFNLEWAYELKDQCRVLGIPYFFKQIDKIRAIPEDLYIREFPIVT